MKRNEIVARRLRDLRKQKSITEDRDITQKEVAEANDIHPSTMSAYETNGNVPLEVAWRLADYYGVSLDELCGRAA